MTRRMTLIASVAATLCGVAGGVTAQASGTAPTTTGSCVEDASYPPGPPDCPDEPALIEELAADCDGAAPYLIYRVSLRGDVSATTLAITFVNPGGDDHVLTGLPLEGRVLWPGTVLDPSGQVADWPGLHQDADGDWVEGDEWSWTRPQVTVALHVNPTATAVVAYPQHTSQCFAGPPDVGVSPSPQHPDLTDPALILPATR